MSVLLSTKIKITSTEDVYRQTDAALTHVISGDIPVKNDTNIDLGMMKGKMLFSGDEKKKCMGTSLVVQRKCKLMSIQLGLGIYWVGDTAATIITFKKGPVFGLFKKAQGKTFLVDVRRKKIQALEPMVGFKKYMSAHYKAYMETAYDMDVLKPAEKELASDPKPEKKKRGRPATAASKRRKQAEMKRRREEEEEEEKKKEEEKLQQQKEKEEEEEEEEGKGEKESTNKDNEEIIETELKKKKRKLTKQTLAKEQSNIAPKNKKSMALLDILNGDADTAKTRTVTKRRTTKKK